MAFDYLLHCEEGEILRYMALTTLSMILHCGTASAVEALKITVGAASFEVEIAQSLAERARGLMFRTELAPQRGMLFVQPSGTAAFWMKNTYIALDLLYFDADGRLVQIYPNVPPCLTAHCPTYASSADNIRYILEINAGAVARYAIQLGDRLALPMPIPTP